KINRGACMVKSSAAAVLDASAGVLDDPRADAATLQSALAELDGHLDEAEQATSVPAPGATQGRDLVSALDPAFRAQELSFAVTESGANAAYAAAAERRTWIERVMGRQPHGVPGTLMAAQERASAHVDRQSVWLHNSVRGAIALAAAVAVAGL